LFKQVTHPIIKSSVYDLFKQLTYWIYESSDKNLFKQEILKKIILGVDKSGRWCYTLVTNKEGDTKNEERKPA
jgi:hypothetical protein